MPLHTTIDVGAAAPVAISSGTITGAVRVQNLGVSGVWVQATTGAAPTAEACRLGGLLLPQCGSDLIDLATRFPGVAGATALFALAEYNGTRLSVSHAS